VEEIMTTRSKTQSPDAELIEQAIAALIGGPKSQPADPAAVESKRPEVPALKTKVSASKGRRYGPAERAEILAAIAAGKTADELFASHGVARETIARWKFRAKRAVGGSVAAPDPRAIQSGAERAPLEIASSPVPEASADEHVGYHAHWREALKVWRSRPGLGPAQIRNQLYRAGIKITVATTRKILEENGYTPPKAAVKEVEINTYEAVRPLELVHMDFKHFYINRAKVYLLLLQDDYSRFLCAHKMTESENMKAVIQAFEETVARYGKMQSVMTDAGSAFYSWNGINRFQRLLTEEYGVDQIKARSPRSNGKIENVNKQIEKEVLDVERYASLEEAEHAVEKWIRFYNFERTHMGLPQGMVPADRFLFGWNQVQSRAPEASSVSRAQIERETWTEMLKVALARIKQAA
jgi:transposase InsO family protein